MENSFWQFYNLTEFQIFFDFEWLRKLQSNEKNVKSLNYCYYFLVLVLWIPNAMFIYFAPICIETF
jgi:hypothetical protein